MGEHAFRASAVCNQFACRRRTHPDGRQPRSWRLAAEATATRYLVGFVGGSIVVALVWHSRRRGAG